MFYKKSLLLTLVAVMLTLLLVSCSGGAGTVAPEETQEIRGAEEANGGEEAAAEEVPAGDEATGGAIEPFVPIWQEYPAQIGGEMVWALSADIGTLDPPVWRGSQAAVPTNHIYEPLYDVDRETGEFYPRLATSWELSEDKLEYTFNLRQGVLFHNGDEMTCEDVLFSVERVRDPEGGGWEYFMFDRVEEVTCADEYTLVVNTVEPDNYFYWTFFTPAGYVLDKSYFEENGEEYALSHPVGTGPFEFVSFEPGNQLVVERFDEYWDQSYPLLDRITFKILTDPTTILTGLRNNEIQTTWDVAIDQLRLLEDDPNVEIETTPGVQVVLLHMNNTRPPFDDMNVRRAIAEAIDMEEALSALYPAEYVQPASGGFAAPGFTDCNISDELNGTYTGDIEKARDYLSQTDYPDGFNTSIVVDAQNPLHETIALHIQERLAQIGINVEILKEPTSNHTANVYSHDFDMNLFYWNANQNHILNVLNPMYHSNNLSSSNFAQFDNPEYDAAVEKAYTTPDAEEACEATEEAQRILTDQVPSVPLAYPALVRVSRTEVQARPLYPVFIWDDFGRELNYLDR